LGLEQALVVANPIPDGKDMARELPDVTPGRRVGGIAGRPDHRQ